MAAGKHSDLTCPRGHLAPGRQPHCFDFIILQPSIHDYLVVIYVFHLFMCRYSPNI
jgi:hypothetical protein